MTATFGGRPRYFESTGEQGVYRKPGTEVVYVDDETWATWDRSREAASESYARARDAARRRRAEARAAEAALEAEARDADRLIDALRSALERTRTMLVNSDALIVHLCVELDAREAVAA